MSPFTKSVIDLISQIPKGKVMTYGSIAAACMNPRGARQVSYILHSMSDKYQLPWHRVINVKGKISLTGNSYSQQKYLLQKEGIIFQDDDSIDLYTYQWFPSPL